MTQAVCDAGMKKLDGIAHVYVANNGNPNEYLDEMKDADGIIVRIGKLDRAAIEASPNLKVIGRTGVGYDCIDVKAATEHGIPIVITPGANTRSVAEHTVALILAMSKNLVEGQNETKKGNFSIRGANKAFEILDKKIGFIGLGNIGRETAKMCAALGMKTYACDPFLSRDAIEKCGCVYYADYKLLLKDMDFVSIHVPLTPETRDMIAKEQLASMKKSAIIINCSRGGIVNEADLAEALNNGIIGGAGIDVFEEEPPKPDNPLLNAQNIIYSPHSAAQTREAVIRMAEMCVDGCVAVMNGERWPMVANPEAYQHSKWLK